MSFVLVFEVPFRNQCEFRVTMRNGNGDRISRYRLDR